MDTHRRAASFLVVVALFVAPTAFARENVHIPGFVAHEMGVPVEDASRYLRVFGDTLGTLLQKDLRVAIDGFGAFEPVYAEEPQTGEVVRSVEFRFSTGRALAHPAWETVFDEELAKELVAQDRRALQRLPNEAASVAVPLTVDSAAQLLDLVVFAVLFLTDQNDSVRFANDFGTFYGTLRLSAPADNHNTARSNRVDGIVSDFADDILGGIEADLLLAAQGSGTRRGGDPDANRYDFGTDAGLNLVQDTLNLMWTEQRGDILSEEVIESVAKRLRAAAIQHNAARSDWTSVPLNALTSSLIDEAVALGMAQRRSALDSPRILPIVAKHLPDLYEGVSQETRAQDYNSSRSNTTTVAAGDFVDDVNEMGQLALVAELLPSAVWADILRAVRTRRVKLLVSDFYDTLEGVVSQDGSSGAEVTAATIAFLTDLGEAAEVSAEATSHNATGSNRSRIIAGEFMVGLFGEIGAVVQAVTRGGGDVAPRQTAVAVNALIDALATKTTRAQDYNSSRSNTTSLMATEVGDFLGDIGAIAKTLNHTSSHSNWASTQYQAVLDNYLGVKASAAPAQDYNGTRSNRSSGYYKKLVDTYGGRPQAEAAPAQDYNSSRSNTTAIIEIDFNPGDWLRTLLNER